MKENTAVTYHYFIPPYSITDCLWFPPDLSFSSLSPNLSFSTLSMVLPMIHEDSPPALIDWDFLLLQGDPSKSSAKSPLGSWGFLCALQSTKCFSWDQTHTDRGVPLTHWMTADLFKLKFSPSELMTTLITCLNLLLSPDSPPKD